MLATSTPTAKRIPLSPLAAINQLFRTIAADVASGQVRQDVGVNFDNLIQPVKTELAASSRLRSPSSPPRCGRNSGPG